MTLTALSLLLLAAPAPDTTLTLGDRPTVVAFFGLPMEAADADPDVGQVVADLHFFLRDSKPALDSLGVDTQEVYDPTIRIRTAGGERVLPTNRGVPVGYILWSPKGPSYICRGVRRPGDLAALVRVYLDEVQNGQPSRLAQCERADP